MPAEGLQRVSSHLFLLLLRMLLRGYYFQGSRVDPGGVCLVFEDPAVPALLYPIPGKHAAVHDNVHPRSKVPPVMMIRKASMGAEPPNLYSGGWSTNSNPLRRSPSSVSIP
jgi:hypothetical protein